MVGVGDVVNNYNAHLKEMGLHKPLRGPGEIDVKEEVSSTELLRSASVQLSQELKRMYWHGSYATLDELKLLHGRDLKQSAFQDNTMAVEKTAISRDSVVTMDPGQVQDTATPPNIMAAMNAGRPQNATIAEDAVTAKVIISEGKVIAHKTNKQPIGSSHSLRSDLCY
ncbi:hypothetical protein BGZ95_000501 [Linnemannia exigua]|uniref:Uncharacterized protein n=1 Tax=Linnemannia exigua TaxID=604196 RepID=A0AAD4DA93_9FUNG|nr:hypothetical protein BGZ95_000501 [Linnemannia exigua]